MELCFIKITSTYSEFKGALFGPYSSKEEAADNLRKRGWIENINDEEGNWFCRSGLYEGINAVIETVLDPEGLPREVSQLRKRDFQMDDEKIKRIVAAVGQNFKGFGGGRSENTDDNIIADTLKDNPPQFALGVDIREVVIFILQEAQK